MAGDWIKMRGALTEHPKVIAMSRLLAKSREFRDWLTPGGGGPMNGQIVSQDALRCVTCALLLRVWSRSREHGQFDGDDLILRHNSVSDIDQMAGAPGVGKAMATIGWVVDLDDGIGVSLPNFKEYNVPMTSAEKQKEYRKRVTGALPYDGNNSVTRGEESREEGEKSKARTHANGFGGGAGGGFEIECLKPFKDKNLESVEALVWMHREIATNEPLFMPDGERGLLAVIAAADRSRTKQPGRRIKYFRGIVRDRGLFDMDGEDVDRCRPRLAQYRDSIKACQASGKTVHERYIPLCDQAKP